MKRLQIIGYNATLRGPIYFLQYCNDLGSDFATAAVAGASPSGTIKSEASVYKGAITRNWEGLKEVGGGYGRSVGRLGEAPPILRGRRRFADILVLN